MKKNIIATMLTLALVFALAACGGGGGDNGAPKGETGSGGSSSGAGGTTGTTTGTAETQETSEAFRTCEIPGYFSFEVPAEAIVAEILIERSGSPRIHVAMPDSDWGLDIGHVTEKDRTGFESFEYDMQLAEKYQDTFKPVTIGGYAGYSVQNNIEVLIINFPYGEATGKGQPYGSVTIVERDGGDPSKYLDDPIVRGILDSIKIIGAHVHSGAGPDEEPLDEEYLKGLGLSVALLKPEGAAGVSASGKKGDYNINFDFEPGSDVDVRLMATGVISAFRNIADNQKLYNVYVFREDPRRAGEKTVDSLVKGIHDDFVNNRMGTADFGLYASGTPVYVYMTFGMVTSSASDEPFPLLSIIIKE